MTEPAFGPAFSSLEEALEAEREWEESQAEIAAMRQVPPNNGRKTTLGIDETDVTIVSLNPDTWQAEDYMAAAAAGAYGWRIINTEGYKGRTGQPVGRPKTIPAEGDMTEAQKQAVEQFLGVTRDEFATVVRPGRKSKEQKELRQRIAVKLYEYGGSPLGLARVYGCSEWAIHRLRHEGQSAS